MTTAHLADLRRDAEEAAAALAPIRTAFAPDRNAWNLARLADIVADLAAHVARLDADSIGDAFARGVIEHADTTGRTYDDDPDSPRSVAYDTGRNIGDALVTPPGAQILADLDAIRMVLADTGRQV